MPKQKKIFTDFSGGEWSPKLEGRIDTPGYYKSCRILENFIIAGQGGAERTPGTVFVANGKTDADTVRLIPFELASGNYILELGDAYMRFYKNHAQLEDAGSPVEIVTPWAKEDLFEIKYIQTADAMYFFHTEYQTQKLTWTSDINWTIANVAWAGAGVPDFTTANNRPGAGGLFDQRLWLAGTNNKPEYIWGSKPGTTEDFNSTDGLIFQVYYDKRFKIHWLSAKQQIVFGATKGEGILSGGGAPISSTNLDLSVPSPIGNANIQGIVVGDVFVSFHKGLKKVLAFQYSNDVQSWKPIDLTFMASHILGDGVVEADLQVDPDTILWCITSDGQLVGFTYESGAIMSWHSHPTGQSLDGNDKVESVAVITGDTEDEIWISVKRTINGVTKRFIEYFKPRSFGSDQKDCYFVDCGITLDKGDAYSISGATNADPIVITCTGHPFDNDDKVKIISVGGMTEINNKVFTVKNKAADTFELYDEEGTGKIDGTGYGTYTSGGTAQEVVKAVSGLDHLEGETVQVLADGAAHPDKTVSSGSVTLDRYANRIHVGLGYKSKLKPMRLTPPGVKKAAFKAIIRVYDSLGCKVGRSEDTLKVITFRSGDDPMNNAPPLFTGDKTKILTHSWDTDGDVLIVQDQPLPLNIAALIVEIEVNVIS